MGCFGRLCSRWSFNFYYILVCKICRVFLFKSFLNNRYIANRYLIANPKSNIDVEWAYCFDVHLNAVLPLLTILHVGQLPFLNGSCKSIDFSDKKFSFCVAFATSTSYLYCLVGNTVWAIAVGYYIYILFLGFSGMEKF